MGFSVSGATAILFIGVFISFGMVYTAANNGFEQVSEAYTQDTDKALERQNTALRITSSENVTTGGTYLNFTVTNTGSTTLSVNDTDVLVDGSYVSPSSFVEREVAGDSDTDFWLPGETLHINTTVSEPATRIKVVTESGVAATEVV